jgi:hypothetical protein
MNIMNLEVGERYILKSALFWDIMQRRVVSLGPSPRVCERARLILCHLENVKTRRPRPELGCNATERKNVHTLI